MMQFNKEGYLSVQKRICAYAAAILAMSILASCSERSESTRRAGNISVKEPAELRSAILANRASIRNEAGNAQNLRQLDSSKSVSVPQK